MILGILGKVAVLCPTPYYKIVLFWVTSSLGPFISQLCQGLAFLLHQKCDQKGVASKRGAAEIVLDYLLVCVDFKFYEDIVYLYSNSKILQRDPTLWNGSRTWAGSTGSLSRLSIQGTE